MRTVWFAMLFAVASAAQAQVQLAQVSGGKVEGVCVEDVVSFKGIPFAAPPVGERRWKAPQSVAPWNGNRRADRAAPSCMQPPSSAPFGPHPPHAEDCLYLNVWTAARSSVERRPVMVWIHGGGFNTGSPNYAVYDGTHLAKKGVVLVSIAYRLNAFGFLAHPQLTRESGKGSGNFGLQDQIAALRWVRDNIAAFGGDPSRVTIFGQSSGAIAVSMLASSPLAKGLFQRAIAQSGANFAPGGPASGAMNWAASLSSAEVHGEQFLTKLGAKDIAAARAMPAEAVLNAVPAAVRTGFMPVFDGDVLLGDQYELWQAGRFNDVPVMVGSTSDDGNTGMTRPLPSGAYEDNIRRFFPTQASSFIALYPHATDEEAGNAFNKVLRDVAFAWPSWAWATLQARHGKNGAFVYYFDHPTPLMKTGAWHGAELGFVFGTLNAERPGATPPPSTEDLALQDLMSAYWINFAANGDPNGSGLPNWPVYDDTARRVMIFGKEAVVAPIPDMRAIELVERHFAEQRGRPAAER